MPQFKAAFESSPNGLLITDAGGTIMLVNREIERLFGYSNSELQGREVEILVPERFRDNHPYYRDTFRREPGPRKMGGGRDLYGLTRDGIEVPVEVGLTPVNTDEGLLIVCSIVDISERKKSEREQRKLEDQLRQAQKMEAIGQLASGIAHDFNNILQAIMGNAEMIRNSTSDSSLLKDLDEIIANVNRGKSIVDRVLTFGREQQINIRPLDMKRHIQDTCQFLRSTLPPEIELVLSAEPGLPRALADVTTIEQILFNLVNNSVQAVPDDGRIDVALEPFYAHDNFVRMHPDLKEGWYVRMMVRDNGKGMDKETLARAFDPFFTTKGPGMGTGLGLSLVHGLVREHGGSGWIESEPGGGTTVSCLFPAINSEEVDYTGEDISIPYGEWQKVLCVDDEASLQSVNKRLLTSLGYRPSIYTDPVRALEAFRNGPDKFDAAVIDYSMPVMNGIDLTEELLKIRENFPVVIVSGSMKGVIEDKFRDAGARHLIRKPFTRLELAHALHSLFIP